MWRSGCSCLGVVPINTFEQRWYAHRCVSACCFHRKTAECHSTVNNCQWTCCCHRFHKRTREDHGRVWTDGFHVMPGPVPSRCTGLGHMYAFLNADVRWLQWQWTSLATTVIFFSIRPFGGNYFPILAFRRRQQQLLPVSRLRYEPPFS